MTLLSNIWRNEKSREIIIQIFVLFCIGWLLSWLVMNVNANFKALGKDISFEFLFIPDISFKHQTIASRGFVIHITNDFGE